MNAKALVIGLGGIGSEIVNKLEKKTGKEKKDHVRYVIVDTDVNTISRLEREGFSGNVVTMSDRMTVGEYLDASTSADAWFLRNEILDFKPMTEGAGQVRAVSRLAFELAVKKQKLSPLYEAIRQLHISTSENREGEDNAFRVIIVSTLAGGTGSGIILPLALHIRQYMREVYRRRDVIIRGIFLMADCLDNVVGSETERRSLRSNTYAAVKELDAFMKKADGYLDERYGPYICLEERSGVKNSSLLSYNYCYLFSARNEKSNELYSFEELQDYVVLCIYAQILGPMQELHNSIEDNVLKSTMTANISGRASEFNRYCAAGISILEYPYRNILDYLSIEKMLDVFSEQWMEIDDAYEKEMDRLREKEKAGYYVQKPERSDFYRNYVLSADDGNLLFRQIRRETETGSGEKKWDAYREALDGDINEQVKQREELWKGKKKNCTLEMKMLRDRPLRDRKRGLGVLREAFVKLYSAYMQEGAPDEASVESRYFGEISEDYNVEPHHFYYWLKSGDGLIHMNSVRYFLYWTIAKLKDQRVRAERELEDCGSLNEICRQLEDRIRNTQERMIWVSRRKRDSIANDCKYVMGLLDTYSTLTLKIRIYQVGMDRLSRISESLEDFYRMFSYNCRQIRQDKDSLYKQMTQNKSRAVTYVGTSADYLDAVREDVKDYQKDTETNRRLSGRIFEVLWNVSKQDEKDRMNRIRSLFRKECLDFWRENLEKEYAYALDMDIVEAIRREGAWKKGKDGAGNYLKCMLSDMWDYTVPFLQTESAGNAGLEKNFCTYDWGVFSHHDNETKQILERHLTQNGGTDGKGEVDKYTIYFYRVLYNLKATDLQEFLVGQLAQGDVAAGYFDFELLPENAGRTFRDYYEAVNMQDATRLTPHIDKRWGNILMMPDLNPAYTVRRETQIYQAFFSLWLDGAIAGNESGYTIRIKNHRVQFHALWEIFEQFCRSGEDISAALGAMGSKVLADVRKGICFKESTVGRKLEDRGMFRLPYEYLREQLYTSWDEAVFYNMVRAVMELTEVVLGMFYQEEALHKTFEEMVYTHYQRLCQEPHAQARTECMETICDICRETGRDILHDQLKGIKADI